MQDAGTAVFSGDAVNDCMRQGVSFLPLIGGVLLSCGAVEIGVLRQALAKLPMITLDSFTMLFT